MLRTFKDIFRAQFFSFLGVVDTLYVEDSTEYRVKTGPRALLA